MLGDSAQRRLLSFWPIENGWAEPRTGPWCCADNIQAQTISNIIFGEFLITTIIINPVHKAPKLVVLDLSRGWIGLVSVPKPRP